MIIIKKSKFILEEIESLREDMLRCMVMEILSSNTAGFTVDYITEELGLERSNVTITLATLVLIDYVEEAVGGDDPLWKITDEGREALINYRYQVNELYEDYKDKEEYDMSNKNMIELSKIMEEKIEKVIDEANMLLGGSVMWGVMNSLSEDEPVTIEDIKDLTGRTIEGLREIIRTLEKSAFIDRVGSDSYILNDMGVKYTRGLNVAMLSERPFDISFKIITDKGGRNE